MQENKNQNKKSLFWRILLAVSALVLAFCVAWLGFYIFDTQPDAGEFKAESSSTLSQGVSSVELPGNPVDFAALQRENTDIYGWIEIPNTKIDYPILQAVKEDDGFYLDHDWKKNYDDDGAIYSERKNKTDFSDPNTVLYGHNMRTGAMFQNLHKFKDKKFFDENKYIYVYIPGHILTYEICAAYRYDNRHILNSFNFYDKTVFEEYLEYVKNPKSMIVNKREVELNTDSKLLTLSTCINNKNYRYLVQGVLIKDELTK